VERRLRESGKLLSRVAHSQQGAARTAGHSRFEAGDGARAVPRETQEPQLSATELAAEEMDLVVTEWFGQVLQEAPVGANHMLSTRGRLALLLVDMPGKWQEQFLHPPPWPEEFIKAMREAYLRAGPDFQLAKMAPRPLDLGPIATLSNLSMLPFRKMIFVWFLLMLLFVVLFVVTHNSQQNHHLLNEFVTWVRNLFD
jgi:hypothetical protein